MHGPDLIVSGRITGIESPGIEIASRFQTVLMTFEIALPGNRRLAGVTVCERHEMKFVSSALITALYITILLVTYCLHVWFFRVDVDLYSALLDALIAAVIASVVLFWPRKSNALGHFEKMLLLVVWLLGGYAFAISIPTVLDRSLSFYILEKLDQRGGGILADRFGEVFTDEYMHEFRLVDVRLTEQDESGTIKIENGCVMLTDRG